MEKILTIVTVSKNNFNDIKKTFSSIKNNIKNFKKFVKILHVDKSKNYKKAKNIGVEILRNIDYKFHKQISNGCGSGFNEALELTNSKYIFFLNSGDLFKDEFSLSKIFNSLSNKKDYDFLYFDNYQIVENDLKIIKSAELSSKILRPYSLKLPCHQSCVFKTSIHKRIKYPVLKNKSLSLINIIKDTGHIFGHDEYVIRKFINIALRTNNYKYINEGLTIFDTNGLSCWKSITFIEFIKMSYGHILTGLHHRILTDALKVGIISKYRKFIISFVRKYRHIYE